MIQLLISSLFIFKFLSIPTPDNTTENILRSENKLWEEYKKSFELKFDTKEEDEKRMAIFHKNLEFIKEFNAKNHSFKLGETPFTHLTNEEFSAWLVEMNSSGAVTDAPMHNISNITLTNITDRDWRKEKKVTPVKNQLSCGSGYAFAATSAAESVHAIKNNKSHEISKQELLDCSTGYGNRGCSGGSVINSLKYLMDIGAYPDIAYPYVAKQGTCKRPSLPANVPIKISGHVSLPARDEFALASTVSNHQPVAVMIFSSLKTFQLYKSGVYYDEACNSTIINHGALVVGVESKPSPHYILKNSWGTRWGEDGYMLLARNKQNQCGVSSNAVFPTI